MAFKDVGTYSITIEIIDTNGNTKGRTYQNWLTILSPEDFYIDYYTRNLPDELPVAEPFEELA